MTPEAVTQVCNSVSVDAMRLL